LVPSAIRDHTLHASNEDAIRYLVRWLELLQEVIACVPDYLPGEEIVVCYHSGECDLERWATVDAKSVL
jgi:hypothetical protein